MEEDEGVYFNAHSSPTKNWEKLFLVIFTYWTQIVLYTLTQCFNYYQGHRLTHTAEKKQFTEHGIYLPNYPGQRQHCNIRTLQYSGFCKKGVWVFTSITPQIAELQRPESNRGVFENVQVNKLTLNQVRICQEKAH